MKTGIFQFNNTSDLYRVYEALEKTYFLFYRGNRLQIIVAGDFAIEAVKNAIAGKIKYSLTIE